jgi:hypothetical protein
MGEINTMTANKKMWIGKTPRQWLVETAVLRGNVKRMTARDALLHTLEEMGECPAGSPGELSFCYWLGLSTDAQVRVRRDVRRKLLADDRLMGQHFER